MDFTGFTVKIALLFLPGIFGALLYERLTIHKPWTQFRFFLYILLISVSSYAILSFVYELINALKCNNYLKLHFWDEISQNSNSTHLGEVTLAVIVSILLSVALTYSHTHGLIYKFFQSINVTKKYGTASLYLRILQLDDVDWIYLRAKTDSLTFLGQVAKYSEDEQNRELVLYNVTVYSYPESVELYKIAKIYLCYPIQAELQIEIPEQV